MKSYIILQTSPKILCSCLLPSFYLFNIFPYFFLFVTRFYYKC